MVFNLRSRALSRNRLLAFSRRISAMSSRSPLFSWLASSYFVSTTIFSPKSLIALRVISPLAWWIDAFSWLYVSI